MCEALRSLGRFRLHCDRPQSPTQIGGEMHVFRDISAPSYQALALGKYSKFIVQ